jgi:hypothetical protein
MRKGRISLECTHSAWGGSLRRYLQQIDAADAAPDVIVSALQLTPDVLTGSRGG